MTVIIDGTTGITTPGETVSGNISYTGTLTGGTGVVNLGSGQVYKDASGNVGIGTSSPTSFGGRNLQVNDPSNGYAGLLISSGAYTFQALMSANNGVTSLGMRSNHPLVFTTNDTERARIDTSGNLLVGKTTSGANNTGFEVASSGEGFVTRNGNSLTLTRPSEDGGIIAFRRTTTQVGSISVTTSATAYNTSSDYRLKDNIAPMTGALAKVALLKPVTYKWKVDGSDGQGFIAHELAEVEAGCVTGEKDAVDSEGNPQYQGIDTSFLVATLTSAIQEQQTLITALTARITALETA